VRIKPSKDAKIARLKQSRFGRGCRLVHALGSYPKATLTVITLSKFPSGMSALSRDGRWPSLHRWIWGPVAIHAQVGASGYIDVRIQAAAEVLEVAVALLTLRSLKRPVEMVQVEPWKPPGGAAEIGVLDAARGAGDRGDRLAVGGAARDVGAGYNTPQGPPPAIK
jgi:hypothetical protein